MVTHHNPTDLQSGLLDVVLGLSGLCQVFLRWGVRGFHWGEWSC